MAKMKLRKLLVQKGLRVLYTQEKKERPGGSAIALITFKKGPLGFYHPSRRPAGIISQTKLLKTFHHLLSSIVALKGLYLL